MKRTHNSKGWHKLISTMLVFRREQKVRMQVVCEEQTIGKTMRFIFPVMAMLVLSILLPGEPMASMFMNSFLTGDPNAYLPQKMYKHGAVYTRQVVLGPNGLPQYVGYDEAGNEAAYYGEIKGAKILSATHYNALLEQLNQIKTQFPQLELLDRNSYSKRVFKTVNGDSISSPILGKDTVLIAVRPASQLFTTDTNPVLMESLVDLRFGALGDNIKSLLLNEDGTVNADAVSPYNIGPRVAYYGDIAAAQGDVIYNPGSAKRTNNDTIFGPLPSLLVEVGADGWFGVTDQEGKYHINYRVPACPGFTIMYPNWIFVNMKYHRFNPKGLPDHARPLYWENQDFCNGLGALSMYAANVVNGSAVTIEPKLDFPIDLSIVNGRAKMGDNVVVSSGDTTYNSGRANLSRTILKHFKNHDFDRDGTNDHVEMGRVYEVTVTDPVTGATKLEKRFEIQDAALNPTTMGIWLSSFHNLAALVVDSTLPTVLYGPDLTRLTDWSPDFEDRALLSQLNADDLLDTDLYIFRESDGSLLIERRGLKEEELRDARVGVAENGTAFEYTLRFLSRSNSTMKAGISGATNADEFMSFQVREGVLNKALHKREADQLRPGEQLRIVAINRPTGYIGSTTFTLDGASSHGTSVNVDTQTDDIILAPPNLRIWAERRNKTEFGARKGQEQEQIIGSEGAGLANDLLINLYTEWLDAENHPLPSALGEYGYTGRLAMLTEGNQLQAVGGNFLANFAIKPGRQLQVVRLPENVASNQHLYVHVTGTPHNRDPKFTASEVGVGILQFRPDKFVPVKVPLYDEAVTDIQLDAWRKARASGQKNLELPEPLYQWLYRPEFQFTIYDLTMQEILREDMAGQRDDILRMKTPILAETDQLLDMLYDLFAPVNGLNQYLQALQSYSYNGNQELIFSFGEQELIAHFTNDGHIVFDNIDEVLAALNPDDLLTIQLYANNDSADILWEYTFGPPPLLLADLDQNGKLEPPARPPTDSIGGNTSPDKPTKDKPYRFWINDDDDNGEVASDLSDIPGVPPLGSGLDMTDPSFRTPDYEQNAIGFSSDFEDYFPLGLDIEALLNAYPPQNGYKYVLRHADEAFNFTYADLKFDTAKEYLTKFFSTGYGPALSTPPDNAQKQKITASGVELTATYLNHVIVNKQGVLLVDARAETKEPIELAVKSGANDVFVLRLPIETSGVEDMFRHVNLAEAVHDKYGNVVRNIDAGRESRIGEPVNYPDDYASKKYFVFVHGYLVSQEKARAWHAEAFKRLYQMGSKARFVGVTWHGDTGLDYHEAVKNAFMTGESLNAALSFIDGDVTVAAHSLGNMVVSNAITQGGFRPNRYYMVNAAVPIEAYSSGQTTANAVDMRPLMTEDSWKPYLDPTGANEKLFANGWHTLFTDARKNLTWGDRFRDVLLTTPTYNFYSSGDDVVENPGQNETVLQQLWDKIIAKISFGNTGRHAWVAQETIKGRVNDSIAVKILFGNLHGGWGYNQNAAYGEWSADIPATWTPLPPASAAQIPDADLRIEPFFMKFEPTDNLYAYSGDNLFAPDQDATANAEAAKLGTQYKLLAEAIPAKSFAAAANSIKDLGDAKLEFNMNDKKAVDKNGNTRWPSERLSTDSGSQWLHSDVKDIALLYTNIVWKNMIDVGALADD